MNLIKKALRIALIVIKFYINILTININKILNLKNRFFKRQDW